MAYHIFKIFPNKSVEFVASHDKYHDTRTIIKKMRGELTVGNNYRLKMIFAATKQSGAKLIVTEKEFVPYGDD